MSHVVVVTYHAVADYPNLLAVTEARLSAQLRWLLSHGFQPITFREAVEGPTPAKAVAVTFDDGYRSVYERARPVLDELGISATVFVVTGQVGSEEPMSWPGLTAEPLPPHELLPMSWKELDALVEAGWDVGSHTVDHLRLPPLDDTRLRHELGSSKTVLEQRYGGTCDLLAYPFGDVDPRVEQMAGEVGYSCAATMSRRCGGALASPRVGLYFDDGAMQLSVKVARPMLTDRAEQALSAIRRLRGAS